MLNEVVVRLVHAGETPRNNGARCGGGQGQSSPKNKRAVPCSIGLLYAPRTDQGKRSKTSTSGLCGAVLESGQAALVCNPQTDVRIRQDLAEQLGITTALAVPVKHDGALVGALMVLNRLGSKEFTQAEEQALVHYAETVAEAIEEYPYFAIFRSEEEAFPDKPFGVGFAPKTWSYGKTAAVTICREALYQLKQVEVSLVAEEG